MERSGGRLWRVRYGPYQFIVDAAAAAVVVVVVQIGIGRHASTALNGAAMILRWADLKARDVVTDDDGALLPSFRNCTVKDRT